MVTSNRNPSHCTHSSHRWDIINVQSAAKQTRKGVTTLLTPTPGCPAPSTEDDELDETTKLRTGSCQGWLEEELPRVAGCEVSTQKTRWPCSWSTEGAARPSGCPQTSWSRTRNTTSGANTPIQNILNYEWSAKTCAVWICQNHLHLSASH